MINFTEISFTLMRKSILFVLPALMLLLAGCKSEKPGPTPPVQDDIPEGTIPVVFHVLYEDAADVTQNPSAAIIRQRLDLMNKFYASTLFTQANIPGVPSRNIGLTFTLATRDPQGKVLAEPGIDRVMYAGSTNMSADDFLHSSSTSVKNKAIFWDPNRYVNIWLFGFLTSSDPERDESSVTGISFLPYCTTTHPLALLNGSDPKSPGEAYFSTLPTYMHGITLNNRYFLPPTGIDPSNQWGLINEDERLFTLCHEMGHYLGLRHAFSETNGCDDPDNASDDGCADTPKYDRAAYMATIQPALDGDIAVGELPYNPYERQPCDGSGLFLSTNVMDYYFSVRTQFTSDQKGRIEHVVAYSPLIPRGKSQTKALLENFTGEIPDVLPEPILMRCFGRRR